MSGTTACILRLHLLSKRFGSQQAAVQGITLNVRRGETIAVIGPSGAGKTTLFRMLNLSLPPTSGSIIFAGSPVASLGPKQLRAVRRRIGSIYQQHHLVGRLRVLHNVLSGRLGRWPTWRALLSLVYPLDLGDAAAALRAVGLADKLYERTDHLSGGQQQRVALARVLLQDADLILADEPVASVDPQLADEIVELLVTLGREAGKTLIVSLHHVGLALRYFSRVLGLRDGEITFDCRPDEVTPLMLAELYGGDRVFGGRSRQADHASAAPAMPLPTTCLHFQPPATAT
ncbi:MAG: phosphonate ABC transporter ATP-binding protein [Candidatus Tectomicrobia bacterium]|nr:phosphonate ABC transporter ATP-binding protein [Candidatus Tectomicrobia bacterium]